MCATLHHLSLELIIVLYGANLHLVLHYYQLVYD